MSTLFKFIFESFTDPLSLPISVFWDYVIIAIIGFLAYVFAYRIVGNMYRGDFISSSTAGSFFHWTIRLVLFVLMFAVVYVIIQVVRFLIANWLLVIGLLFALLLVIYAISEYKKAYNESVSNRKTRRRNVQF